MVKTLQKKFVVTSMLAITILIVFLLGVINVADVVIVRRQVERTLNIISENEGNAPAMPRDITGDKPPLVPDNKNQKNEYDTFMSSNFFIVRFDADCEVTFVDVVRTSTVTEDTAVSMANEAVDSGKTEGKVGKYRYMIKNAMFNDGVNVVFLDTAGEMQSILRVLILSVLVGAGCFVAMFLIVILLSKKAIRPIAENIEKQKRFVTDAGHELKTPLAIIQSNAEAMELYNGENKWSKNIKEQTVRLSKMTENLLLLSRMDEGNNKVNKAKFNLSDATKDASESFIESFKVRGVKFDRAIESDVMAYADRLQIEKLIDILLDNALKYTNDKGSVVIMCHKEDGHAVVSVENTCEKLPDTVPEGLFDRFYRADTARNQSTGGSGIGLSVARSIVMANDGEIKAEYIDDKRIRFKFVLSES
jgi:signal transduction histidine kinase